MLSRVTGARLLKPSDRDLVMMRKLSLGFSVVEAGKVAGYEMHNARKRIRVLTASLEANSLEHLNYTIHSNYWLPPLNNPRKHVSPTHRQLEAVQLLAWGKSTPQISKELHLSFEGARARLIQARRIVNAKNNVHLITLCWSRNFIV